MNSLDTRSSRNVFEAVQKTRSTCVIGSETARLRLVVLNPIKHCCSCLKQYIIWVSERPVPKHNKKVYFEKGLVSKEAVVLRRWRVEANVKFYQQSCSFGHRAFRALAFRQSGGQVTLPTPLIKPNIRYYLNRCGDSATVTKTKVNSTSENKFPKAMLFFVF